MVYGLTVLAIVALILIFVVSYTLIISLNDNVKDWAPLTMRNMTSWAEIPGGLDYNYTKAVTLFDIKNFGSDGRVINMKSSDVYNFQVSRSFKDPVYDDQRKIVNYTMEHTYDLLNDDMTVEDLKDIELYSLNFGA